MLLHAFVRFQNSSWSKTKFLGSRSTVNTAELTAISLALTVITKDVLAQVEPFSKLDCSIFSDSKYAVEVCNSNWDAAHHHFSLVCKIADQLTQLKQHFGITVKIIKIKSHSGIHGNDTADSLAKKCLHQSLQNQKTKKPEKCQVPFSVAKVEAKIAMMHKWQKTWNLSNNGRKFFELCPNVSDQPPQAFALSHTDFGLFSRLLTGHIGLNAYLFSRNLLSHNMCLSCNLQKIESIEHFLLKCPKYQSQRLHFFTQHPTIALTNCTPTINTILKMNIDWSELLVLIDFVKSTGRFLR